MKLFDSPFGIHEKALMVRNQRMQVIASNIANADTPHFKARDIDFKKVLGGMGSSPMMATNVRHFATGENESPEALVYRVPFNSAADGNTVEMGVEQARYGEAASDFQTTLSFLEGRISGIRKALKGD
jgi:flagellar basal-body rod protein FlgB